MGEENRMSNCQLFICKTTDLVTGKEEWTEVKHVDNICLREKTTIPELEVKEPWHTSLSFTATCEYSGETDNLRKRIREYQGRRHHYIGKILSKETKDCLRKSFTDWKAKKFKNKRL